MNNVTTLLVVILLAAIAALFLALYVNLALIIFDAGGILWTLFFVLLTSPRVSIRDRDTRDRILS